MKGKNQESRGKVYLVGAGPGDPGLLTIKAWECLQQADVLIYDRLVSPRLEYMSPPETPRVYVGKSSSQHTVPQDEISHKLIEWAQKGNKVVRLKGGDPFVFGRGGEEAQELSKYGIPFEIIPGITSATSVPAYSGIPVTHRNIASSFAVITGHEDSSRVERKINYSLFANAAETLIFLMGVENLTTIARELIEGGISPEKPAAIIRWGTRAEQTTLEATIQEIPSRAEKAGISPPAVLVVGEVVSLRKELSWRENMPLFGKRILVTRAAKQAGELTNLIEKWGGEAWEFPVIKINPPPAWDELDSALRYLSNYQWLIFTSVNGVEFFFRRMAALESDIRNLAGIKIAAIGSSTANALQKRHLQVDLIPQKYQAENLVNEMLPLMVKGEKVLLPRAAQAREVLPRKLKEQGIKVDEVCAYHTVEGEGDPSQLKDFLREGKIHAITFTSPSTVRNFFHALETEAYPLLEDITLASIGPITSGTIKEQGFYPQVEAEEYTISGLMEALLKYFLSSK